MKKNIIIALCFILTAVLGACSCYFYIQNRNHLQAAYQNLEQSRQLSESISDLKASLSEKEAMIQACEDELSQRDDFIKGQEAYIRELADQLSGTEEADDPDSTGNSVSGEEAYQQEYPDLYAQAEYEKRHSEHAGEKMVYLTFDDGPSNLTPQVLDLLDEYHAKATFFVVYSENETYTGYLSEIVERGHTLALHSGSHNYKKIYASVDAFLADFQIVYDWVYEETGQRPTLFRFPGGSTNGKKSVVDEIIREMERRGFLYYDWNVSSGDGSNLTTSENIIENVSTTVGFQDFPVVLMHDGAGKQATLDALPQVLEFLRESGYSFGALDETMTPVQHNRHRVKVQ